MCSLFCSLLSNSNRYFPTCLIYLLLNFVELWKMPWFAITDRFFTSDLWFFNAFTTLSYPLRAKRMRKVLGGGMRQTGIVAAAGLIALDRMITRLQEDHDHIYQIAKGTATQNPNPTLSMAFQQSQARTRRSSQWTYTLRRRISSWCTSIRRKWWPVRYLNGSRKFWTMTLWKLVFVVALGTTPAFDSSPTGRSAMTTLEQP